MPRKKWIDKNSSTTYQLLHRPQNDPRLHDPSSSSMVFSEVPASSQPKTARTTQDLEVELFGDDDSELDWRGRDNEGEAAEHGIYYDDTEYDYMQHMRGLGGAEGTQATWVEAPVKKEKGKGKDKVELAEALREMDIEEPKPSPAAKITDSTILPSTNLRKTTYQDQQDIPDALAGFQPDMDPRLREALEALEDEAFVDPELKDDDFFSTIAKDGRELSLHEFEGLGYVEGANEEDEGWLTDDTAKPNQEYKDSKQVKQLSLPQSSSNPAESTSSDTPASAPDPADSVPDTDEHGDGAFMASFRNLPKSTRAAKPSSRIGAGSIMTGASALTAGGRHKKRKGAKTNSEAYSMTSSSIYRTEGLTTLDARFEKTLETYMEDGEEYDGEDDSGSIMTGGLSNYSMGSAVSGMSKLSGMSGMSRASEIPDGTIRKDFDSIMDEFLEGHSMQGKRRVKKGGYQSGIEQLDEVRRELGKPVGKSVVGPRKGFV